MLLTVKQAAERLNCCESQVYALLGAGRIAYVQIGLGRQGGKRIDERDLEAFLAAAKRCGTPPRVPQPARPTLKRLSLSEPRRAGSRPAASGGRSAARSSSCPGGP
jgi:excisionase family DNA binding protein